MESEPRDNSPYMPATAPGWATYYKNAKATRRLGKGQHARIQSEAKRRRRQANLIALASTAVLVAVVALCAKLLGGSVPASTDPGAPGAASRTADVRRG
jgi:hypothetical protein